MPEQNEDDAEFQADQLARYHARGLNRLRERWDEYLTCLITPSRYLESADSTDESDAVVSYEAVRKWRGEESSPRAAFKRSVFEQAIGKERRRTGSEVDEEVTGPHHEYQETAYRAYPGLGLDEPTGVAPKNHWIRFDPPTLPDEVALYHEMRQWKVDLEFDGMADREEEFRRRYEP